MQELAEMMHPKGFQFRGVDLMDVDKEYAFPVLRVVGSMDRIGKADGTATLAEDNIARAKIFEQDVVVVRNTSHLDVLNESAVDSYIDHVLKFFDEGSIGSQQVRYVSPIPPRIKTISSQLKSLRAKSEKTIDDLDLIDLLVVERNVIRQKLDDTIMEKAVAELTANGLLSITEVRSQNATKFVSSALLNARKVLGRDLKRKERNALRNSFKASKNGSLNGFQAKRESLIGSPFTILDTEKLILAGVL